MNKLTLSDLEHLIPNPTPSGNGLRGDCPLCGGKNTFCANENGKLLLRCHKCEAPFKKLLNALGGTLKQSPASKTNKPKPTHAEATATALKEWDSAGAADPKHPYYAKKGVQPHGLRQDQSDRLIIPARNIYGEITTLQTISATSEKRFFSDCTKQGSFFILDDQDIDPDDIIYIAEGFATAATVQEATNKPTICAFDAGNLLPVAEAIRGRYPSLGIILVGDDDRFSKGVAV